ncbi:mannose-1-phosphate guanylyltransferase/mannose-6-phosphate isomerase [Azospirillum sp.]|uniref:mannose-1-phosphate guanylyltransferase/mannose-6-phosphate isomerase n=1 Tax=Azospirillum sp. TaxID=34012 RepID=UPI00260CCCC0|nr:mannose-1-phosphate guanylyltransferase/mannose-6-phosphate isomerase [Azospirillum sp.]
MTRTSSPQIHPVILSGGSGTRLWPMSREHYPKQLLSLCSNQSMLQDTAARVRDTKRFAAPLLICNQEHRFIIAEQIRQIGLAPQAIVLEPVARNTAAAAAVAALTLAERDPNALLLLLPADHLIRDQDAFLTAVDTAATVAATGRLVTFGIVPHAPETGYGYIRRGTMIAGHDGSFNVAAFIEKPTRSVAEEFLASGEYLWNSGMFLFPVGLFLAELERFEPAVLAAAKASLATGERDLDFFRLDKENFATSPGTSIDYAVMERTEVAAVVAADMGWTDVGSWSALWEVGQRDANGNVHHGDVLMHDTRNSYVRSECNTLVALVGLDDTVVVATDDAILVAARDRVQDVKVLVEQLKRDGRTEPMTHRKVHRPWGFYQSVHEGDRFQVKRLTVAPGARLSLQKHYHRAEHWVVVNGTALVTRGEEQILLRENESVYIPLGTVHRLENPGKVPLNLIEVQSGSYLGEDDIVRIDDTYGRT